MHDDKNIHGKIRLEHVISFADAIFAFSITFMAISIQIPNLPDNNITQTELIAKLLELRPQFETYVISFFHYRNLLDFISSGFQPYYRLSRNNDMAKSFILILHYAYFFCHWSANKLWIISYYFYNICINSDYNWIIASINLVTRKEE
jgi:hypothetical protein